MFAVVCLIFPGMDSDDELPELGPLADNERAHAVQYASSDEDSLPALVPIVERHPFLVSLGAHEHSDVDDMPALMSISDFSDDADVSSFYYSSGDDVESEWESEEEFDEEFDEDLPPLRPSYEDAEESDEEDPPSPYTRRSSHIHPFLNDEPWLPRHVRHPGATTLLPDGLLETIAFRMESGPREPVVSAEPDLVRAKLLVAGLERVCGGLLERMLRVGGAPGAYEDVSKEDNSVSGCAICWETLLDKNTPEASDVLPFAPENDENEIVCLPCAHVFHSSCLIPWFSQKTSCPTCVSTQRTLSRVLIGYTAAVLILTPIP